MHQGFSFRSVPMPRTACAHTAHTPARPSIVIGNASRHWPRCPGRSSGEIGRRNPAQLVAIMDPRPCPRKGSDPATSTIVAPPDRQYGGGPFGPSADVLRSPSAMPTNLHQSRPKPPGEKSRQRARSDNMRSGEEDRTITDKPELKRISRGRPAPKRAAPLSMFICSTCRYLSADFPFDHLDDLTSFAN